MSAETRRSLRQGERATMIKHMLDSLENPSRRLTSWELDFIADVADRYSARGGDVPDGTFDKLEEIYAEKTA